MAYGTDTLQEFSPFGRVRSTRSSVPLIALAVPLAFGAFIVGVKLRPLSGLLSNLRAPVLSPAQGPWAVGPGAGVGKASDGYDVASLAPRAHGANPFGALLDFDFSPAPPPPRTASPKTELRAAPPSAPTEALPPAPAADAVSSAPSITPPEENVLPPPRPALPPVEVEVPLPKPRPAELQLPAPTPGVRTVITPPPPGIRTDVTPPPGIRTEVTLPPSVRTEVIPPPATPPRTPGRQSSQESKTASLPAPLADNRNFFEKLLGIGRPTASKLGYDQWTAVYDISAHAVYMPDGTVLEAHSGLGDRLDDPNHVAEKDRGATPPHLYDLEPRTELFHGVQALRLTPVGGGNIFGRNGLLAHTFMLGPKGDSNGCVSFRNYNAFLQAFQRGVIKRLAVVARAS